MSPREHKTPKGSILFTLNLLGHIVAINQNLPALFLRQPIRSNKCLNCSLGKAIDHTPTPIFLNILRRTASNFSKFFYIFFLESDKFYYSFQEHSAPLPFLHNRI